MSRLGKTPVPVPAGVTINADDKLIRVKGSKGELTMAAANGISITIEDNLAKVARSDDSKTQKALHGMIRAMLANMIVGVTEGYARTMRIVGTGYRVELQGKKLTVHAGYGHPVIYEAPDGVELELPKSTSREYMDFIVRGIDKQKVNETAAQIRRIRPPNPYKGKGIRYADEKVRLLEGKSLGK